MTNGGRVDNLAFQNTCMESTYKATGPPQDNAELQKNMMDSNSQGMENNQEIQEIKAPKGFAWEKERQCTRIDAGHTGSANGQCDTATMPQGITTEMGLVQQRSTESAHRAEIQKLTPPNITTGELFPNGCRE
jgi:hypothetical protein